MVVFFTFHFTRKQKKKQFNFYYFELGFGLGASTMKLDVSPPTRILSVNLRVYTLSVHVNNILSCNNFRLPILKSMGDDLSKTLIDQAIDCSILSSTRWALMYIDKNSIIIHQSNFSANMCSLLYPYVKT